MSIYAFIKGITGNTAKVNDEGAMHVINHLHPPEFDVVRLLPFSQFFTVDGTQNSSEDMRVDGSINNIDFFISAQNDRDIYVKSISIQISDPSSELDLFGSLPRLTNGIEISYLTQKFGKFIINDSVRSNLEIFRVATGGKGFGSGTGAFLASTKGMGGDTYIPDLDLKIRYGLPWGLLLLKGSNDKLIVNVKDDLSAIENVLNIRGFGMVHNIETKNNE